MNIQMITVFSLMLFFNDSAVSRCDALPSLQAPSESVNDNDDPTPMSNKIKIKIGAHSFTATLNDNATAKAFKAMLPLTIDMDELNGNEKFADLSTSLPVNASRPSSIKTGDLMLYGASTLVLFYKAFSTSYSYTKIGQVDNADGLAAALGAGDVTVKIENE